jgi:hypothetical protein
MFVRKSERALLGLLVAACLLCAGVAAAAIGGYFDPAPARRSAATHNVAETLPLPR